MKGSKPEAALLGRLRERMAREGLHYYLVPSTDAHQNEYLPPHTRRRQAASGFTGSAGDLLVGLERAYLFVDSRYHLQADQETDPALMTVCKLGVEGVASLPELLVQLAGQGRGGPLRVGYDPFLLSGRELARLEPALKAPGVEAVALLENLVDGCWEGRPADQGPPLFALPDDLTGETVADKLERVRQELAKAGAGGLLLSRLDEVAWLTNLRGGDIDHNPVFQAYLLLTAQTAVCFTDRQAPGPVRKGLEGLVAFAPYQAMGQALRDEAARLAQLGEKLWLDGETSSQGVALLAQGAILLEAAPNPVARLKAVKNPVELVSSRQVHLRAAAAKIRSFARLEAAWAQGEVSEAGYADWLEEEYRKEEGFYSLSFPTIAAYGPNGALVHYGQPGRQVVLRPGGLLLVDSGVQMGGATTDDTRTVWVGGGPADELARERYTLVLRGHIRLAMQQFPQGTTGYVLDGLARSPLWNEGMDYGHGTGHGVGAFLNVHEGPQNLNGRGHYPLEAGMVLSVEPGYYKSGWGGIRLENLYLVEEALGRGRHPSGKGWLRFSPLTLIPFDRRLIDWERLTGEESRWLQDYHHLCLTRVGPLLEGEARRWLEKNCRPPGEA